MSIPSGFLLINKLSGPTSHNIVDELRRITGERRIGHAGTLDPFASGLLIVAVGRESTRQISQFSKMDKTYIAKLHLGATSNTFDRTGLIQNLVRPHQILSLIREGCMQNVPRPRNILHRTEIERVLKKFVGRQTQIPPMYSAKKIGGKKLYELARKGIEIERKPAEINIHYIKLLKFITPPTPSYLKRGDDVPHLTIETRVSSGIYIRTLAHDIGQALGCGAYLEELQRTEIGKYKLENAVETKNLTKENWTRSLLTNNDDCVKFLYRKEAECPLQMIYAPKERQRLRKKEKKWRKRPENYRDAKNIPRKSAISLAIF